MWWGTSSIRLGHEGEGYIPEMMDQKCGRSLCPWWLHGTAITSIMWENKALGVETIILCFQSHEANSDLTDPKVQVQIPRLPVRPSLESQFSAGAQSNCDSVDNPKHFFTPPWPPGSHRDYSSHSKGTPKHQIRNLILTGQWGGFGQQITENPSQLF